MRRILLVIALSLIVTATTLVYGQRPRQNNQAGDVPTLKSAQLFPAATVLNATTWNVNVSSALELDAETEAVYQQMADDLTLVNAVPNDRVIYYSGIGNNGNWRGSVSSVSPVPGGANVTVIVGPDSEASYASDYSELYFIDGLGNATYLGFSDPEGTSGQALESVTN